VLSVAGKHDRKSSSIPSSCFPRRIPSGGMKLSTRSSGPLPKMRRLMLSPMLIISWSSCSPVSSHGHHHHHRRRGGGTCLECQIITKNCFTFPSWDPKEIGPLEMVPGEHGHSQVTTLRSSKTQVKWKKVFELELSLLSPQHRQRQRLECSIIFHGPLPCSRIHEILSLSS